MLQSHLISLSIRRPVAEVYDFLAEPRNFPKWAAVVSSGFRQIGPDLWAGESPVGERLVKFCPRNDLGVLDHAVYRRGEEPVMMPMRVVPNGADGCELTFLYYRRPGVTDEEFASGVEWIESDFKALQSMLEI